MRKLTISSPGSAPVTHELADTLITIGRGADNLLQLADPSVSSRHAQITATGDIYELTDLGSTNGTRVNGVAVTTATLRVGDQIRFGKVEACFECELATENQPLPIASEAEVKPADVSARPADFANASPFQTRMHEKDASRLALYAAVGVAILAFIGSMLALLQMQPPAF